MRLITRAQGLTQMMGRGGEGLVGTNTRWHVTHPRWSHLNVKYMLGMARTWVPWACKQQAHALRRPEAELADYSAHSTWLHGWRKCSSDFAFHLWIRETWDCLRMALAYKACTCVADGKG